jgi:hypothetical protein
MSEQVYEQFIELVNYCTQWQALPWFADVVQEARDEYPRAKSALAAILKVAWNQTDWWDIAGEPEMEERWTFWRNHEVEVYA